jgi:hypothetical protein
MVSDSTLGRASGGVVLNSVAFEHHDLSVVEDDGEIDNKLSHGSRQDLMESLIELKVVGRDG